MNYAYDGMSRLASDLNSLQPVFQYYVDVGANPALPNAPAFGFRTKANF